MLSYLLVAMFSASFGLILGTIFSAGKIDDLYHQRDSQSTADLAELDDETKKINLE